MDNKKQYFIGCLNGLVKAGSLMLEYNIRHQAVMENDEVTGILSIEEKEGSMSQTCGL